jgi:hypothetical protein
MKGAALNDLNIKISVRNTNGELAVFEPIELTTKGRPALHIHPHQPNDFIRMIS